MSNKPTVFSSVMKAKIVIALALMVTTNFAYATCSLSDIKIMSMKAKFIKRFSSPDLFYMQGVAVLENRCDLAVGVQLQITGYEKSGSPVVTNEFWPASIRNIPPGSYTFSLNQSLQYEPSITHFDIKIIDVKKWR